MEERQARAIDVRHQNHLLPETETLIFSIFSLWLSALLICNPMSFIAMEVNRFLLQTRRPLFFIGRFQADGKKVA